MTTYEWSGWTWTVRLEISGDSLIGRTTYDLRYERESRIALANLRSEPDRSWVKDYRLAYLSGTMLIAALLLASFVFLQFSHPTASPAFVYWIWVLPCAAFLFWTYSLLFPRKIAYATFVHQQSGWDAIHIAELGQCRSQFADFVATLKKKIEELQAREEPLKRP